MATEVATFAAGCFWKPELKFSRIDGVISTRVGYTGGTVDAPSYELVCTDTTGHAEAVEVTFDPTRVTYDELLTAFWAMHDPTQVNRQGPDVGRQYRTAIFVHNDEQRRAAEASKSELAESGKHTKPIVTQIVDAGTFFPAEEYHQRYLEKRGVESCGL